VSTAQSGAKMAHGAELYKTEFGSLADHRPGRIEIVNDDPKNYAKSNVFEVAKRSAPYERVVVGKNMEYVIEAARVEGDSPWFTCAHDEFALCMDGAVEIHLLKPLAPQLPGDAEGAHLVQGEAEGQKMGRIVLGRGHQALLPANSYYRFAAATPGVITIQTMLGPVSIEKWAEICESAA